MNASQEFVKGKHGIGYVDSDFLSKFKDVEFAQITGQPVCQTLTKRMKDVDIESELKPGICTLGDVLAVITSEQKEYKDGNWNLFYFEECVVGVHWYAVAGEWLVSAWDRDDYGWSAGRRVFSAASDQKHSVARSSDRILVPSDTHPIGLFMGKEISEMTREELLNFAKWAANELGKSSALLRKYNVFDLEIKAEARAILQ